MVSSRRPTFPKAASSTYTIVTYSKYLLYNFIIFRTCVLEKRHIIGGAAVTEEIVPGFKFSRASYVLSLLRPQIMNDLELKRHGLKVRILTIAKNDWIKKQRVINWPTANLIQHKKLLLIGVQTASTDCISSSIQVYLRHPSSYTPLLESDWKSKSITSLTLGMDHDQNKAQIAQFSQRDAKKFGEYEAMLNKMVTAVDPLLDHSPPDMQQSLLGKIFSVWPLAMAAEKLGQDAHLFYEMMTAPTTKILNKWFESEPLKATLATDACIGAMISPGKKIRNSKALSDCIYYLTLLDNSSKKQTGKNSETQPKKIDFLPVLDRISDEYI